MTCEQAANLLADRVDSRQAVQTAPELEAHLATCATCRAAAEALASQERLLVEAFADRRAAAVGLANRVNALVLNEPVRSPAPRPVLRIARALLAAAAGFAIAVLVFRPWNKPVVVSPVPTTQAVAPAAQLSLATGRVFVCPDHSQDWRPLETGGSVGAGVRVRTAPSVRCELKMADGSEVRLNDQTEIRVAGARRIEVAAGQVYSSVVRRDEAFVVHAPSAGATLTALGTGFDVACSASSAVLTVAEGSVQAAASSGQTVVKKGESVSISAGQLADKQAVASLMQATAWVDEILVMKGRDNPELSRRVDDIFAQLGQSKMWYMQAQEVRRLGDHCVVPLTRYIQSDRSKNSDQQAKRRQAADIIGDVATTSSLPELINLLNDPDGEVRYSAARALRRLTGQDLEFAPEEWRDQSFMTCVPPIQRWHAWWEKNKGNFPTANPSAVKPIEVVKSPPGERKG